MFNKRRVTVILAILAAVVAGILSSSSVRNYFTETETSQIKFQTGIEYNLIPYGKEILLVNNEGIRALDKSGREAWNIVYASTSPAVYVKNRFILIADMNGKNVSVYSRDKLITQIKTEKEILCAKLNKNGYVAVATDELGFKGMITVYNRSGKEVFKWHSGSGYIGDFDISQGNRITVAQLMTDKEKLYSNIISINASNDGKTKQLAEIDGLVSQIKYRDDGGITAVSDGGVYAFRKNGGELFKLDFTGRTMTGCNIENEHNMVFAFESGLNNTVLESYSKRGELRGSYESDSKVRAFDVNGECIVVGNMRSLTKITPAGKVKSITEIPHDVKNLKIFSGRDRAIVIGGKGANIVKIR